MRNLLPALVLFVACAKTAPNETVVPTPAMDGASPVEAAITAASRPNLTAFASEDELTKFFDDLASAQQREVARRGATTPTAGAPAATASVAAAAAGDDNKKDESITNTQEANVDEGGIVKAHGDHLVILRRGRLFTVRVGDDSLAPIAHVDAFGPDIDPSGGWYDEMLLSGDTVAVVGYSYQRGGTEVGLFDLDRAGGIKYRATYHLRSNDYYSSRNYASRIVGNKLVFYSPMYLPYWSAEQAKKTLPAMRLWHKGATDAEFKRILAPTRIYRPVDGFGANAMHTVTVCDLAQRDLPCQATAMIGPAGRVFYVSENAVYVWMTDWSHHGEKLTQRSMLARMPLDGSGPSAILAQGAPVDQFSFSERGSELDVLVRSESKDDAMWAPETAAGDLALARVPIAQFSAAVADLPRAQYTRLTKPTGNAWAFQNRFVGDYLLYGTGSSWGYAQPKTTGNTVFAFRVADEQAVASTEIPLDHPVDRIEALGKNAVVIGGDGAGLHFTAVALGATPRAEGHYVRSGASQGETRSQGFFYKPAGESEGMLALPIRSASRPGWSQLGEGSASMVFLKNHALDFQPMGELEASNLRSIADQCRASCVDWYGNARPIFYRGRVFALMGYEIVEGKADGAKMLERRRISFSP